jgi:hypothetical protein
LEQHSPSLSLHNWPLRRILSNRKMEAASTPRISGPYLDNYVGRNVMVVGKVVQLRGDQAIIDADGNVTAHLNRVSSSLQLLPDIRRKQRQKVA